MVRPDRCVRADRCLPRRHHFRCRHRPHRPETDVHHRPDRNHHPVGAAVLRHQRHSTIHLAATDRRRGRRRLPDRHRARRRIRAQDMACQTARRTERHVVRRRHRRRIRRLLPAPTRRRLAVDAGLLRADSPDHRHRPHLDPGITTVAAQQGTPRRGTHRRQGRPGTAGHPGRHAATR